ncbi:MAG: hypothetical protein LBM38_02495 [Clostridiales bacterium]|jgi:hypothetical protein|nr:hypothetical protein [Clostridiales bacterium]
MVAVMRKDINLIPDKQRQQLRSRNIARWLSFVLMLVMVLGLASIAYLGGEYIFLSIQNDKFVEGIAQLEDVKELNDNVESREAFAERRASFAKVIEESDPKLISYIEECESVVPSNFKATSVAVDDAGIVTLSATAPNQVVAADSLHSLVESKVMKTATITSIAIGQDNVTFTITGTR